MPALSWFFLAALCIPLAGCLYLPIAKTESPLKEHWSEAQLTPLLGQPIDQVKMNFPSSRTWTVFDGRHTHLIYGDQVDWGLLILAGGTYGGAVVAEYMGTRTQCIRLSFEKDGRLYAFDRGSDTDPLDWWPTEINDCRLEFWTEDELASIRQKLETRAESGDSKAEAMLLEFSFGDDLVRQSEIDVGALWSAAWEAAVEDHPLTLRERALAMRKAAKEEKEALRYDLVPRAENGDVEAQVALGRTYYRDREERWYWICRAAHGGHSEAMMMMAARSIAPRDKTAEKSEELALFWFLLAENAGSVQAGVAANQLIKLMPQGEVVEVREQLNKWVPDPSSCDTAEGSHVN